MSGHAVGTQGYVCLPTSPGASTVSWTVNAPRPEATLFDNHFGRDVEIVTHFLSPNNNPNKVASKPLPFGSPTWQSSLDISKVWGQRLDLIPAGSDESCPNTGSIDCLLLQAAGSEAGPSGGKLLTQTTFIQRLNTKGGSAPATGAPCSAMWVRKPSCRKPPITTSSAEMINASVLCRLHIRDAQEKSHFM